MGNGNTKKIGYGEAAYRLAEYKKRIVFSGLLPEYIILRYGRWCRDNRELAEKIDVSHEEALIYIGEYMAVRGTENEKEREISGVNVAVKHSKDEKDCFFEYCREAEKELCGTARPLDDRESNSMFFAPRAVLRRHLVEEIKTIVSDTETLYAKCNSSANEAKLLDIIIDFHGHVKDVTVRKPSLVNGIFSKRQYFTAAVAYNHNVLRG